MTRVLFVDDDALVLAGLRRGLARERGRWELHFALGADAALQNLAAQQFDVIVTDMRMPGCDGATLLTRVQHDYPDLCRVVLSGECGTVEASAVANTAQAFLTKPCEVETIVETISRLLEVRSTAPDCARALVGGISSLPSPPIVLQDLSAELMNSNPDPARVTEIIEHDVAIAAKVLQLANSAFYGLPRRVTAIDTAVHYMGINTIKDLASTAAVFRSFDSDPRSHRVVAAVEARSNQIAEIAVRLAPAPLRQAAHVAALLHDVGLLVLNRHVEHGNDCPTLAPDALPEPEAEMRCFGTTHAEVGAYLLSLWGIPEEICDAARTHHDAVIPPGDQLDLRHITHVAVALHTIALGGEVGLDEAALQRLGVLDAARRVIAGDDTKGSEE